jgi:hypothetical protein
LKGSSVEKAALTGPKWTQDEAIDFECARDCITDLMGIYSGAIDDEETAASPDQAKISELLAVRSSLARERMALRLNDHDRIAEIRSTYGARIRTYRAAGRHQAI